MAPHIKVRQNLRCIKINHCQSLHNVYKQLIFCYIVQVFTFLQHHFILNHENIFFPSLYFIINISSFYFNQAARPSSISIVNIFSLVYFKSKARQNVHRFSKFYDIPILLEAKILILIIHKPSLGSLEVPQKKIGPDLFSCDVYWMYKV